MAPLQRDHCPWAENRPGLAVGAFGGALSSGLLSGKRTTLNLPTLVIGFSYKDVISFFFSTLNDILCVLQKDFLLRKT